jgi:hypothetical protein
LRTEASERGEEKEEFAVPSEIYVKEGTGPVRRSAIANPILRLGALLLLLAIAPLREAWHITAFSNGNIWWHLSTGLWILQNHAVPHSGLFSQYPDRPWIAMNWGFDVLVGSLYRMLGLRGVPVLFMAFKMALAAVTFWLAYSSRRNFWLAVLLSAVAQYVIVDLQPLPILFSILFFGIELTLLLQSRRTGSMRALFWLPLLFVCWANLHQQFVLGLILLALFLLAGAAEQLLKHWGFDSFTPPGLPLIKGLAIAGISCVATLVNPYGFRLLPQIFPTLYSKAQFQYFAEMNAMAFRRPQNFVLMLLVMAAFLALGRQRSRDLFKISAMVIFVMLGFRFQRDAWCIVFLAIAVLAAAIPALQLEPDPDGEARAWRWRAPLAAAVMISLLSAAAVRLPNDEGMLRTVSRVFPVKAADYIRANRLAGPIFNSYSWGGFLSWYLPEYPVAIDGRLNLYGEELTERYFKVTAGETRLEDDPSFVRARIILLERTSGMTMALTKLPALKQQFRVAYEDASAVVLVRVAPTE